VTNYLVFSNPQALCEAQKANVELREENRRLKALNLDLNMGAATAKRSRRALKAGKQPSGSAEPSESSDVVGYRDFATTVQKLGQHHQLFWCVLLDPSHFSPETRPDWAWDTIEIRYSTPDLQKRGPSAELYAAIPQEYHDLMALSATSSSKINFVKQVRHVVLIITLSP